MKISRYTFPTYMAVIKWKFGVETSRCLCIVRKNVVVYVY